MAVRQVDDTISGHAAVVSDLVAAKLQPILAKRKAGFAIFDLLAAVHAAGVANQAEIARRLGISPPSLTETVHGAVRRGFVEQNGMEGDLRAKALTLTPSGKTLLEECLSAIRATEERLLRGVPKRDIAVALRVLKLAQKNLTEGS